MPCPTPEKIRHKNEAAALAARETLERKRGIDLALKPYRCGGHWHLGHRSKRTYWERKLLKK